MAMQKDRLKMIKNELEASAWKPDHQPVGLGGKNPHTIKPPPPMPQYTVVQASVKRRSGVIGKNPPPLTPPPPMPQLTIDQAIVKSRFRCLGNPDLRAVTVTDAYGKVIITGKKGKVVKISNIAKLK